MMDMQIRPQDMIGSPPVLYKQWNKLDDSLFSKELAPHYMKLAGQLAASELVPKCYRNKPSDLFLCWSMGYQVGLAPEQAMQCIAVINGKPSMYGDDMLALVMAHKDFEDIIEEPIQKNGAVFGYICTAKRKNRQDKVNKFDLEDAKRAGLLAKGGVWTQYPERMLKLRARGFTLRDAFPDVLKGIKPREEVEDYIDAEYREVQMKSTRTETLKQDLLSKKGESNVDRLDGFISRNYDQTHREEAKATQESQELGEIGTQEVNLHSQIKQLLDETGFPEERFQKALKFYQVESVDELEPQAAQHFYEKLMEHANNV